MSENTTQDGQNTAAPNATGRDAVIFELALEAARTGNLPMADYLTDKAIEAEKSGGTTTLHLPGMDSRVGTVRSLENPFWKSAAQSSVKSNPTPHRYNETLDMLGFYDGIKSFEDVTGLTLRFLEACTKNPIISLIIRRRIYQATRYCKLFNPITNNNRESGSPGFRIKMREDSAPLTRGARKRIAELQDIILHGGISRETDGSLCRNSVTGEPGVWDGYEEEKARTFDEVMAIQVRQSLGMDFAPMRMERGVDARKYPVSFFAPVDATRIRRTVAGVYQPTVDKSLKSVAFVEMSVGNDGRVVREFDWSSMDAMIRYPRVDFFGRGYGYCEIEDLLDIMAIMVLQLKFKKSYLDDNYIPNMLVTMSGQPVQMSLQTIEVMRSQMQNQTGSSHWNKMIFLPFANSNTDPLKTYPLREQTGGLNEIQGLQQMNIEMVTLTCGMFGMHPEEIGYSGVTAQRQTMNEPDPQSRLEYSEETGLVPLLEKSAAFWNRFIVDQYDPDFQFEFVNMEPKQADDPAHMQMLMEQGLTPNRINDMRDMPHELVPLEPDLHREAVKKVSRFKFDTDEEYMDAVEERYQKLCKKQELKPYSDLNDMPIGNPEAMQVIMQEKQENDQIKMQANGQGGMPTGQMTPEQMQQMQQMQMQGQAQPGADPEQYYQPGQEQPGQEAQPPSPSVALRGGNSPGMDSVGNGMQKSVEDGERFIERDGRKFRVMIEEVSHA